MKPAPRPGRLTRLFAGVVRYRWLIVIAYALAFGPAAWLASRVTQDNSLERLIVRDDPDYIATKQFEEVFGNADYAVLLAEAPDPYAPAVLARLDALEQKLKPIPRLDVNSALATWRRVKNGFTADAEHAAEFKKFATGTDIFRRQGLVGPGHLTIALTLSAPTARERGQTLDRINAVLDETKRDLGPITALRTTGQPYVDAYLDKDTRESAIRYFPLFGLFVIVMNLLLYRSVRTLIAFGAVLAVSSVLTLGLVGATSATFTIVSSLVPMTILIVATATLVYVHSRFVERPDGVPVDEHQLFALDNKFLACTASVFATAVGFAALVVSKIRPIREMGLWVAGGLVFTWLAVFTLFPALQKILKTPSGLPKQKRGGDWFLTLSNKLPRWTYRYRYLLVAASLVCCALGAGALFGVPGLWAPMKLETDPVEYINHRSQLYADTQRTKELIQGFTITEVWLKSPRFGDVTDVGVVRGLEEFQSAVEKDPRVVSVVGPVTVLRLARYAVGEGDTLPSDDDTLEQLLNTVEAHRADEPALQRTFDANLSQTHFTLVTKTIDYLGYQDLSSVVNARWRDATKRHPGMQSFEVKTVGLAPLQAKITFSLVPTLTESFGLTVAIIFGTFLVVFRNGAARLMAMIPSLFAILAMFGVMRMCGMVLNVATILIASTVLGTSENDQIHFFFHYQERQEAGPEEGLRHTLHIAGRAIFFATLINAVGFLAFAFSDLPPIRHFAILTALALVLSMLADFTALPAALWLIFARKKRPTFGSDGRVNGVAAHACDPPEAAASDGDETVPS